MKRDALYHATGICIGLAVIAGVYFVAYRDGDASPEIGRAIAYQLVSGDQLGVVQIAATKALTKNAEVVPVFRVSSTCDTSLRSIGAATVRIASFEPDRASGETIKVSGTKSPLAELCLHPGGSASGLLAVADLASWASLRNAGLQPAYFATPLR